MVQTPLSQSSSQYENPPTKYIVQTLRGIYGTNDTGYEWYQLLATIFTKVLHMVSSVSNKGLPYWSHDQHYAHVTLAIDDILISGLDISLFHLLTKSFDQYFDYTTTVVSNIHFLNYRLIQSSHGILVD